MSPGYEFRLPSYPSTAFPSLTTAHTGMIARDRTLGGIRMYTGTSTNWTHLGGEVINVKDPTFGAVGDGVTDDTAAIQAAIDVLSATGGTVLIPTGTYIVSSQIQVRSQVRVLGYGRASQIQAASSFPINTPVVRLGLNTGIVFNVELRDLYVECNGVAGSIGVYSTEIQEQCGLRNVLVRGYMDAGFRSETSGGNTPDNFSIEHCECIASSAANGTATYGIDIGASYPAKILIQDVTVNTSGVTTSTGAGVRVTNAAVEIVGLHVEEHTDGVLFDTGSQGVAVLVNAGATTNTVRLNTADQVTVIRARNANVANNVINDAITGAVLTGGNVGIWVRGGRSRFYTHSINVSPLSIQNITGQTAGPLEVLTTLGSLGWSIRPDFSMRAGNGTTANPSYGFTNDPNTGMMFVAADVAALIAGATEVLRWAVTGVTIADAMDIVLGTTSGSKIGTSTAQKLAFWGQTPTTVSPAYTTAAITTGRVFPSTASISTDAGGAQFTSRADLEALVRVVAQMYEDLKGYGLLR